MRVYTHKKGIVTLKHFRFSYSHFLLLAQMQADQTLCNCLLEKEGIKREFIPVHELDLEDFRQAAALNLPAA